MAITNYQDLVIYNDQFNLGFYETVQDQIDIFNAASLNTIQLLTFMTEGLRDTGRFWDLTDGHYRRTLGSFADHTPANFAQAEEKAVKIFDAIHYAAGIEDMVVAGYDPAVIARLFGRAVAEQKLLHYRDTAMAALVGAFKQTELQAGGTHELVLDATAGGISGSVLNNAKRLMGDAAGRIRAWVMHSSVYFDLIGDQLASDSSDLAYMTVVSGTPATLNMPVIYVDSPALINENGSLPDTYNVFGLVEGAVRVEEQSAGRTLINEEIGNNQYLDLHHEYSYNIRLKGVSYVSATDNPSNAVLSTATPWSVTRASKKSLLGVQIIVSQPA